MLPSLDGTQIQVLPASPSVSQDLIFSQLWALFKEGEDFPEASRCAVSCLQVPSEHVQGPSWGRLHPFIESQLSLQVRDEWHLSSRVCSALGEGLL